GLVVFPIDFVLKIVGSAGAGDLVAWYLAVAQQAFAPTGLPTWLPRLALIVLGTGLLAAASVGLAGQRRPVRGSIWWRMARAPMSASTIEELCWRSMWDLVRGAAPLKPPPPAELARRYTEMLADNLGQPG